MHPLPTTVRDLARVMGEDTALKLSAIARNRQLYVPHQAAATHPIVKAIGQDGYQRLRAYYGGEQVSLAKADRAQRVRSMKQALVAGVPAARVAEQFGVTERRVRQVLASKMWRDPDSRDETGPTAGHTQSGKVTTAETHGIGLQSPVNAKFRNAAKDA